MRRLRKLPRPVKKPLLKLRQFLQSRRKKRLLKPQLKKIRPLQKPHRLRKKSKNPKSMNPKTVRLRTFPNNHGTRVQVREDASATS